MRYFNRKAVVGRMAASLLLSLARAPAGTQPAGQTILITQGLGWVQRDGEAIQQVQSGDVVFFEPEEKHWHGASTQLGMSHLAITEVMDGKAVDWLEPVSDEQYEAEGIGTHN